ncbi:hypothetical protein SAMN06296036_112115 [Pseudobacteriovorax antillogorgiicola]|uniref:Uncharacterized protein n=1 Tax=Pseudobacteriovorax antillogorgiicola TaxID=1513793 RepID=A0A1Y6C7H9_9BACT|nr:hypothetical protein EDD56_112116 [Pseudobacteriovorax antillogorgiicola]SMF40951.1 hypothetical protein SAMN06296036_112115 [Pseudobacteriovorax antillogorgiicola]
MVIYFLFLPLIGLIKYLGMESLYSAHNVIVQVSAFELSTKERMIAARCYLNYLI